MWKLISCTVALLSSFPSISYAEKEEKVDENFSYTIYGVTINCNVKVLAGDGEACLVTTGSARVLGKRVEFTKEPNCATFESNGDYVTIGYSAAAKVKNPVTGRWVPYLRTQAEVFYWKDGSWGTKGRTGVANGTRMRYATFTHGRQPSASTLPPPADPEIKNLNEWPQDGFITITRPGGRKYLRVLSDYSIVVDALAAGPHEVFRTKRSGNIVTLQAYTGFYVCAEPDDIGKDERRVVVDRASVGDAERWQIEYHNGSWTFRAHNGSQRYLRNEGIEITADGVEQLQLEHFTVRKTNGNLWNSPPLRGYFSLKAHGGNYLNSNDDHTIDTGVSSINRDEKWFIVPISTNEVAMLSSHGGYLCAEPDDPNKNKVIADRSTYGYAEVWTVIPHGNRVYSFKSHHGRFLKSENGRITTEAEAIGNLEKFRLDPQSL